MSTHEEIRAYLENARKDFESGKAYSEEFIDLYFECFKDFTLTLWPSGFVLTKLSRKSFMTSAKNSFPKGNCGLASLYLKLMMPVETTLVYGFYGKDYHTFLSIDNLIADITADQFGGPKLYYGRMIVPWMIRKEIKI